ncbi:MepB family protein [uncultured Maribacter sp.]|uniref:MepB family protein n=1 Tax=uncultured Maribacter sp. TaxID=431308 RepID=UPI00262EFD61|nr:MepB family protein [uncultured Maribacter sp.]
MNFLKHQIHFLESIQCELHNILIDKESTAYDACTFSVKNQIVISRKSKITPKKVGQFVTIWKRNKAQITTPYTQEDNFDYFIILCVNAEKKGLFIFPKETLIQKSIISTQKKEGKRGIRVYPSWDSPTSLLAMKTQKWQQQYFILLPAETTKKEHYKKLFS